MTRISTAWSPRESEGTMALIWKRPVAVRPLKVTVADWPPMRTVVAGTGMTEATISPAGAMAKPVP